MPTTKKRTKKVSSEVIDPLSSSGVSSLSGISSYNIRKISVYKNGDRFHRGVKFVINPRVIKDLEPLLNQINDRIELSHGVKKLYSTDGKIVKSIKQLEDGKIYVAASGQFIAMPYGGFEEKVWKPPSRKHSPIFRDDRIKTARTRSQEPRQRQAAREMASGNQNNQKSASTVVRSRSVRTLTEDRMSRRDLTNGRSMESVKKPAPRKSVPLPQSVVARSVVKPTAKPMISNRKPPVPTANRKPKTPKPKLPKPKSQGKTGKPVQTAVSQVSVASSEYPPPNVASAAAEILEFPEVQKVVNVARIHRTPTPNSASPSKLAKSVSAAHSEPESESENDDKKSKSGSESENETEEDEEPSASENGSEKEDESHSERESDEEEEEEEEEKEHTGDEEESVGTDSEVETPSSRKSSSAVSSGDESADEHGEDKNAKNKDKPKRVESAKK